LASLHAAAIRAAARTLNIPVARHVAFLVDDSVPLTATTFTIFVSDAEAPWLSVTVTVSVKLRGRA